MPAVARFSRGRGATPMCSGGNLFTTACGDLPEAVVQQSRATRHFEVATARAGIGKGWMPRACRPAAALPPLARTIGVRFRIELLSFLRGKDAVVFTLAFPPLLLVVLLPVQATRDEVQAVRPEPDLRPERDGAVRQRVLLHVAQRKAAQDAQSQLYAGIRVRRHPGRREDRCHPELEPELTRLRPRVAAPGFLQGNEIRSLPAHRFGDRTLPPQPPVAEPSPDVPRHEPHCFLTFLGSPHRYPRRPEDTLLRCYSFCSAACCRYA